jgi:hypothetical protein
MAGTTLPEEAHDLARAASRLLQHYVQPPPSPWATTHRPTKRLPLPSRLGTGLLGNTVA